MLLSLAGRGNANFGWFKPPVWVGCCETAPYDSRMYEPTASFSSKMTEPGLPWPLLRSIARGRGRSALPASGAAPRGSPALAGRHTADFHAVLREVRTWQRSWILILNPLALALWCLGWCRLMLQWLSLNDSPEGISADEWVRMLQSALPAAKYEPGRSRPEVVPSP
jgi:hypothetical protein